MISALSALSCYCFKTTSSLRLQRRWKIWKQWSISGYLF